MKAVTSYWGKARPIGKIPWHPLAYHSLDVAACAARLVKITPALAEISQNDAAWFSALHDIGKFARGFQEQAPELHKTLQPAASTGSFFYGREYHHSHAGFALWQKFRRQREWPRWMDWMMSASCGHHGQPPRPEFAHRDLVLCFSDHDIAAAEQFLDSICTLFTTPTPMAKDRRGVMSFILAAAVNMADWIGSNQDWFPYEEPVGSLPDYWKLACQRAIKAITLAGLVPAQPAQANFSVLFPNYDPTPIQALADELEIRGQSLIIIEDTTGSGKTEAADVLASRMLDETAHRLIFALPTTATADGIAERHAEYYRRFFGADRATLHLAHGRVNRFASNPSLDEAGTDIAAWSAGDPRLRLSADLAVGTVDQICLAAMPARFNTARLFSLIGAVLIVDEVHAFDTYTGHLLQTALRMHAALGGSAILLSATIPKQQKRQLVSAFSEGAGFNQNLSPDDAYPLITIIDGQGGRQMPSKSLNHRSIPLKPIHSAEEAVDGLIEAAAIGCCVWMRTTVADAIRGYEMLRQQHDRVILLHSRFPEKWRSEIQQQVIARFGKQGDPTDRRGWIVVATQVIQESLDVDFDFAVIDLRPIDALIQAAGRYRRHSRDALGALSKTEMRDPSELLVFMPKFVNKPDERWLSDILPGTGYVYPDLGLLWRTAKVVHIHRSFDTPAMLRQLIAEVYGSEECPTALQGATERAKREIRRALGAAMALSLDPREGYMAGAAGYGADDKIATRWGASMEICLLTKIGGRVQPLLGSIRDSCLRVPMTSISGPSNDDREAVQNWPAMRYLVPVFAVKNADDTWTGEAEIWGKRVEISISRLLGLQIRRV